MCLVSPALLSFLFFLFFFWAGSLRAGIGEWGGVEFELVIPSSLLSSLQFCGPSFCGLSTSTTLPSPLKIISHDSS